MKVKVVYGSHPEDYFYVERPDPPCPKPEPDPMHQPYNIWQKIGTVILLFIVAPAVSVGVHFGLTMRFGRGEVLYIISHTVIGYIVTISVTWAVHDSIEYFMDKWKERKARKAKEKEGKK